MPHHDLVEKLIEMRSLEGQPGRPLRLPRPRPLAGRAGSSPFTCWWLRLAAALRR